MKCCPPADRPADTSRCNQHSRPNETPADPGALSEGLGVGALLKGNSSALKVSWYLPLQLKHPKGFI